jgi:hypothetical protein
VELLPVEVVKTVTAPTPAPTPIAAPVPQIKARALYDFAGTGKNEMPMKKGEIIDVVLRGPAGGWSKGSKGAFPTDYVEFLAADPFAAVSASVPVAASTTASSVAATSSMAFTPTTTSTQSSLLQPTQPVAAAATNSSNPFASTPAQSSKTSSLLDDPFANLPLASSTSTTSSTTPAAVNTSSNAAPFNALSAMQDNKADRRKSVALNPNEWTTAASAAAANAFAPATTSSASTTSNATATVSAGVGATAAATSTAFAATAATTAASNSSKPAVAAAKAVEPKTNATLVKVKYARVAAGPTELTIAVGDMLLVKDTSSKDWWYGTTINGATRAGYFPANYVEVVEEGSKPAARPASTRASAPSHNANSTASAAAKQESKAPTNEAKSASENLDFSIKSDLGALPTEPGADLPGIVRRAGLTGSKFVYSKAFGGETMASWTMQSFLDLFTEPYTFSNIEEQNHIPSLDRLRTTLDCVVTATKMVDNSVELFNETHRTVFEKVVGALRDAQDICRNIPPRTDDAIRFYTFLVSFIVRVRTLRIREFLMLPFFWSDEQNFEHCIMCLVSKDLEESSHSYSLTIINTSNSPGSGIDYHPPHIDSVTGQVYRKLAITFKNVSDERIQNTAFWYAE